MLKFYKLLGLTAFLYCFTSCDESNEVGLGEVTNQIALFEFDGLGTEGENIELSSIFLGPVPTSDITVNYSLTDGTSSTTGTFVLPANEGEADFSVMIPEDNVLEDTTTFTLLLTGATGNFQINPENEMTEIMVLDDEKFVTVDSDTITVSEGLGLEGDTIRVPILSTNPFDGNVTLNYTISGSAVEGTDFELISSNPLQITPDTAQAFIEFRVLDDLAVEPSGTSIYVTVTSLSTDAGGNETNLTEEEEDLSFGFVIEDDLKNIGFSTDTLFIQSSGVSSLDVSVTSTLVLSTEVDFDFSGLPSGVSSNSNFLIFDPSETSRSLSFTIEESAFTGTDVFGTVTIDSFSNSGGNDEETSISTSASTLVIAIVNP